MTESPMGSLQREHYWRILAAAGVEPGDLSTAGRRVLVQLADLGEGVCEGLCDLVGEARRVGFADGEDTAYGYEVGVPFFRHDATVTVTVAAGELAERGMPDGAVIGVAWADGDECIRHAVAGARQRAAINRDDRGVLLYRGWWMECGTYAAEGAR